MIIFQQYYSPWASKGGKTSIYPLEIWTKNQKFLENRKSASEFH